jgi:16S rRNA (guanine(966)-N(2))-methyltransferase RsmD
LRETLFNILAPRIEGARVLDGYAGTGAVGLEACSRGAAEVVFVERDRRAAGLIEENLRLCGAQNACAIMRADIGRLRETWGSRRFDLILLDPPYAERDLEAVVAAAAPWLADGGWLVLEHARRRSAPLAAADLARIRVVESGDSALSFYERRQPESAAAGDGRTAR